LPADELLVEPSDDFKAALKHLLRYAFHEVSRRPLSYQILVEGVLSAKSSLLVLHEQVLSWSGRDLNYNAVLDFVIGPNVRDSNFIGCEAKRGWNDQEILQIVGELGCMQHSRMEGKNTPKGELVGEMRAVAVTIHLIIVRTWLKAALEPSETPAALQTIESVSVA
jgi:hypothetical protein